MNLQTERLILKPYKLEYADEIFKVVKQKEIADTTVMIPHPYPREAVDQWIHYLQRSFEQQTACEFAIFLKGDNRYIGNVGLVTISKQHKSVEVGYFIDVNEWNKGYATEACIKIIEYGFYEYQLNRIYSRCMVRNIASRRVMEKAQMNWEGRHKQEILKNNVFEDIDYLSILAEDYYRMNQ